MDKCVLIASGYPALAVAIAVLWKAYRKSQEARIRTLEENQRILEELRMTILNRRKH